MNQMDQPNRKNQLKQANRMYQIDQPNQIDQVNSPHMERISSTTPIQPIHLPESGEKYEPLWEEDDEWDQDELDQSPQPIKSQSGFFALVTIQCILCIVVAIGLFGLKLGSQPSYASFLNGYEQVVWQDVNFGEKIEEVKATISGFVGQLKPIQHATDQSTPSNTVASEDMPSDNTVADPAIPQEDAAGGEQNNVASENVQPPDYATYAPVIFTSKKVVPLTGKITSGFGYREHPVSGEDDFHKGVDIAADEGTVIKAAMAGEVTTSEFSKDLGNYITIQHEDGFVTRYAHCSKLLVKKGDKIKEGKKIAEVGNTGNSTGSHLHFELQKDGLWTNPTYTFSELNNDHI